MNHAQTQPPDSPARWRRLYSFAFTVRWRIFAFLFAIGFLAYLQQRAVSIAAERIEPEQHFSQFQISLLEFAFVLGYAVCQLPGGLLGLRWGARRTFVVSGALSLLSVLGTAAAPSVISGGTPLFALMFGLQLLMGIAQAPLFPLSAGVFERWFPPAQWGLTQGLQTLGLGLGAAFAPPFIAHIMTAIGWQWAVLWTGLPAIPLYAWWAWYGRNEPAEHPSVSAEERATAHAFTGEAQQHAPASVRSVLSGSDIWLLAASYLAMNYVFYLLANWVFLYLVQERHLSVLNSGWLASAPPLAAAIGAGIGGVLATVSYQRRGARGLAITPLLALPGAGVLLLVSAHVPSPYLAIAALTLCYGLVELTEGSYWAAAMLIGRRNAMATGGLLNTGGNLGGVVGIPIVGWLTQRAHWDVAFALGTAFALVSAACWLRFARSGPSATHTQPLGVE